MLLEWPAAPGEPLRWKKAVDEESERGECDQRHVKGRPHLHEEREIMGEERDRERENETPEPRVRCGARIGDHEEGEDQQRAALELMEWNGEGISEPARAGEQQRGMACEKENGDIGAAGRTQHEDGKEAKQRREPHRRAPLAW
jgi:hypothetical protein